MKNKYLVTLSLTLCLLMCPLAHAALVNGSTLDFTPLDPGIVGGPLPDDGQGSYFGLEVTTNFFVFVPLTSLNGIVLGTTQPADPFFGNIDVPWLFAGTPGVHQTLSNSNVLSASGDTATVDLSGWGINWINNADIDLGSGAWNGNANGVADIECQSGSGCGDGASYMLDYSATVPPNHPSGFGGVRYVLHLEGTITAIPVPAAIWLFISGLLVLTGAMRTRQLD